jgi:recombination associated protein RdgC
MFSKLSLYRLHHRAVTSAASMAACLESAAFVPTTPNQEMAVGFVPPRAENGAFVESIAGHWIARFVVETRKVPADILQRRVDELVADIENHTGRKPGKKERRDIKEQAVSELLPQAFPKRVAVPVWISPSAVQGAPSLLAIGSTSKAVCDEVVSALVHALPDPMVEHYCTELPPATAMVNWLSPGGWDFAGGENFYPGTSCELRANDETRASVRYKNQPMLAHGDVQNHLNQGKVPVSLALNWCDRVAFTLTDDLQIKGVQILDIESSKADSEGDQFDATVAIYCGELESMLADLFGALGGTRKVLTQEGTE